MAGTAEAGDAFGSSLSSMLLDDTPAFLVGSPGEDVGRARNAGMVQTIGHDRGWTQNTRGVPGSSETGDRMGASLGGSVASGFDGPLIGVPGEDASTGAVIAGLPTEDYSPRYLKGTRGRATGSASRSGLETRSELLSLEHMFDTMRYGARGGQAGAGASGRAGC